MQVKDAMTRDPKVTSPETTLVDVAAMMRSQNVGAIPVGENDRLVGMVTDRDIAMRAVAEGGNPGNTTVREVMSGGVYYCFEDAALAEAAETMAEHQVQRLPVLNRDKRLVGMLAVADLARNDPDALAAAFRGIARESDTPRS